jgi:FKBP-type peptidyl-prolyl cis-trans isomerase FkpA
MKKLAVVLGFLVVMGCGGDGAETEAGAPAELAPATAPDVDFSAMTRTETGLAILDLAEGDGAEATSGQTVDVHYTGWFLEGEKFDSSLDRGEPYSFTLGVSSVIAGWHEGVAGMRVGGTRRLVIPPELAYGESGRSGIPPNSTLVFDIELIEVKGS